MLKKGTTVSCGCYNRERSTTHGHARGEKCSTTYNIWCAMNQRCTNPKVRMWPNYGGRGIRVCDRWLESFENFLTDMGERPSAKHSIDRYPNNDGNYEPGNCRWATVEQQARNKRNLRMVEYHGETKSLVDWCDQLGVDRRRAWKRLYRGWTPERAFATA